MIEVLRTYDFRTEILMWSGTGCSACGCVLFRAICLRGCVKDAGSASGIGASALGAPSNGDLCVCICSAHGLCDYAFFGGWPRYGRIIILLTEIVTVLSHYVSYDIIGCADSANGHMAIVARRWPDWAIKFRRASPFSCSSASFVFVASLSTTSQHTRVYGLDNRVIATIDMATSLEKIVRARSLYKETFVVVQNAIEFGGDYSAGWWVKFEGPLVRIALPCVVRR